MQSSFAVTTATHRIHLSEERKGQAIFTVHNASGRPLRGRALLQAEQAEAQPWLHLEGEEERNFAIAGTEQYRVQLNVPPEAPPGSYTFRLDMVEVSNPDEGYVQGPSVTCVVPEAVVQQEKRGVPAWMILAGVAALVLVGLVVYVLWPDPPDPRVSVVVEQEEVMVDSIGEVEGEPPRAEAAEAEAVQERAEPIQEAEQAQVEAAPIQVAVETVPRTISPGEQAEITVRTLSDEGAPIEDAEVELTAGGGTFAHDGVERKFRIRGHSDSNGFFRARFRCSPCAGGYVGRVNVYKTGYTDGQSEWRVNIR